ncbi:MAG: tetratricopeptide repeat protein, partial [bacterium]
GEPGIGKTALCSRFVGEARIKNYYYASAEGSVLHQPGHLVTQLLLAAYDLSRVEEIDSEALGDFAERNLVEQRWLPLLACLLGVQLDDNEWTVDLSTELRANLTAEILKTLIESAPAGHELLILDDLEVADAYSISLLKRLLAGGCRFGKLAVLISSERLIAEVDGATELNLTGLPADKVRALIDSHLVEGRREAELAALIEAAAAGNPLFMTESLQHLRASGALSHLSDPQRLEVVQAVSEIKLAERIEDLQLSRFDQLPEIQRRVLKFAAVIGETFSLTQLLKLFRNEAIPTKSELAQDLTDGNLLESEDQEHFYFARRQTREAIYSCIPELDRRSIHSRVGQLLLAADGPENLFELAHHFAHGEDEVQGFYYALEAAKQARRFGTLIDAAGYLDCCAGLMRRDQDGRIDAERILEYYQESSESAVLEGNYNRAFAHLRDWRRLARHRGDSNEYGRAANEFARLLWKQTRFARLSQTLRRLLNEQDDRDPDVMADTLIIRSEFLRRSGRLQEAKEVSAESIVLAIEASNRRREADANNVLGLVTWGLGELGEAKAAFERSLELGAGELGKAAEAKAANNLAILSEELGEYVEAESLLRRAREIYVELGDRRNASYAAGNLANILTYSGQFREALELFEAADRVFQALGETHPHYYTVGNIADIELLLGRMQAVQDKYHEVMEFARSSGDKELEAETLVRQAEYEFYSGRWHQAKSQYVAALELAGEIGSLEYQTKATIGICRLLIGLKETEPVRQHLEALRGFAQHTRSKRTHYEAEFISGELCRLEREPEQALLHFRECTEFAQEQSQFELLLKSQVRIYELSEAKRQAACDIVETCLEHFVANNDRELLEDILSSPYFGFFSDSLRRLSAESEDTHPGPASVNHISPRPNRTRPTT